MTKTDPASRASAETVCAVEPAAAPAAPLQADRLREVLGCFATGVVIITALAEDGRPVGLTVNSFNSVSLDPPLILWSLARKAPSLSVFRKETPFIVNILAETQHDLCRRFATPMEDKFAGIEHAAGHRGVPRLAGAIAHLECDTHQHFPGGDHTIIIGRVVDAVSSGDTPLVFHRGRLSGLGPAAG